MRPFKIVVLGLSITSSWGNGHATTYRSLLRAMAKRGHEVLFLERDVPWYAGNRDMPNPPFCRTALYLDLADLKARFTDAVADADVCILGSFVPEGSLVGEWVIDTCRGVRAFYDIDTPVTMAKLAAGEADYLGPSLIPHFDLYLSFTAGPILRTLEDRYGARLARALYCSVDPFMYRPAFLLPRWDIGYIGTYSADRQPKLDTLLCEVARARPDRRFVVAGPQYPKALTWPGNVARIEHLPPSRHPGFYTGQRYTLNLTRADMVEAGWSPSVRLFEAAACGTPIISDWWEGLDDLFTPGRDILIAQSTRDVLDILDHVEEPRRRDIAAAGRNRVLTAHTSMHRALELETHIRAAMRLRRGIRAA